jgi:hypothetical protein
VLSSWAYTTGDTIQESTGGTDLSRILFYDDLQHVNVGESPAPVSDLERVGPRTVAATDKAYPPDTKSMKNFVKAGYPNENEIGFGYTMPIAAREGDTAWVRVATYFPTGFDFTARAAQILKYFRFMRRVTTDVNGSRGAVDFFIFQTGQYLEWYPERSPYSRLTIPQAVPIERWAMWEFSVTFSKLAGNNGGTGAVRVWLDGVPVYHDNTRATLNANYATPVHQYEGEEWEFFYFYLINYWNSSDPAYPTPTKDQNFWFAQPAIAIKSSSRDDTPYMDTDSNGNKFIGMAT